MTMAVSPVMRHNQDRPFVIGVCGGSASGKTTVCEILKSSLTTEEISVISCDSFYKALTPAEKEAAYSNNYDFDSPIAIDFELMKLAIRNLMNWEDTVCTFRLPGYVIHIGHSMLRFFYALSTVKNSGRT